MDIRPHLDFLAGSIEHLGYPTTLAHLVKPEQDAHDFTGAKLYNASVDAKTTLDALHVAWLEAKQPTGPDAAAFLTAYADGKPWPPPAPPAEVTHAP